MNVSVRCENLNCFANRGMKCRILQEPTYKDPCPFFKTDEELKKDRDKAIERLMKIKRQDLIQYYTLNVKGYAL